MHEVTAWCAFLGAWLLVAGPILQASLELQELDVDVARSAMKGAADRVDEPDVSPWWWLIPPVGYVLHRRASGAYRQEVMRRLQPAELEVVFAFTNRATGWAMVAGGASLIGIHETFELVETLERPGWWTWPISVAMLAVAAAYTVERSRRGESILQRAAGSDPVVTTPQESPDARRSD
ncbi:hypothetical protein [Allobranchiibius sp. GilTou38]|uniref:hypothetical protein n=1 Tax=Allobranchiibius sp. GilTou38 TaxID=2815210 RepID=UPI001AA10466|nr:hypothetical protein [Allobranchiibius sp. GilTou38]MBO1766185.1 hypothetical protein [Allobranchiibius sp. GilTou38]